MPSRRVMTVEEIIERGKLKFAAHEGVDEWTDEHWQPAPAGRTHSKPPAHRLEGPRYCSASGLA